MSVLLRIMSLFLGVSPWCNRLSCVRKLNACTVITAIFRHSYQVLYSRSGKVAIHTCILHAHCRLLLQSQPHNKIALESLRQAESRIYLVRGRVMYRI